MQTSDFIAASAVLIAGMSAAISIPLALKAERRSRIADIPVINVMTGNSGRPNWRLLTFEIDNKTPGSWTIDQIEMEGRPNTRWASGNWMIALQDGWNIESEAIRGSFPVNRTVRSGEKDTFHVYLQLSDEKTAVSGPSRIGWPRLVHPIIRRFSRRALRISSTKHAWSMERHVIRVPIATDI